MKKRHHNHQKCIDDALDRATEICVARGLRFTSLRSRVLELVWHAHKPIGAYDILGQLSQDGHKAAPPTVYRALDFLLEQGFIHRLTSLNAFIGCIDPGHLNFGQFLICSHCRAVTELREPQIMDAISSSAASRHFLVQGQVVEIVGVCPECSK